MAAYGFAASADESMAMPTALPTFQGQESKFQRNTIATEPLKLETTVDSTYTVGLGDYFEILTPKGFDVVQVSPEGNISVPSCGMVMVDKMKLSEAKDAIKKLLSSKFDERYIQVQLVRPKKMTVSVLGAVQAPGQTPGRATVEQQTRLSGVITLGGGFVGMADKKNIKVIRGNDTLTVNYNEYESEGKGEVNLMLEAGDVIFVPYIKSEATISVETVAANVTVPYVEGRTLGEYLDKTPGAMDMKAKWVKVKKPSGTVDVYELTKARDLRLEPQSHIELWNKDPYIYVGGAVAAVGKALYTPGLHAIDYIGASGVTIITGSFRRVSRIRNGKCESIDPYNGEIQPGDYIEIPRSIYESVKDVTLFLASLLSVVATAIIISTY